MDSDTTIEPLQARDIDPVIAMAREIWATHYVPIIGRAQVDYMVNMRFTPETLRSYIDAADRWLDVLRYDGRIVGYCGYSLLPAPGEMKLEQLYLHESMRGKGLGGLMARHIENRARSYKRSVLMLQVNRHNKDSIAVYRKLGFTVREEVVSDIGGGFVMDDYVMEKRLG